MPFDHSAAARCLSRSAQSVSQGGLADVQPNRDSPRIRLRARFLPLEQGIRHGFGAFAKPEKYADPILDRRSPGRPARPKPGGGKGPGLHLPV